MMPEENEATPEPTEGVEEENQKQFEELGKFLTVEAIIMLPTALLFDVIGLILFILSFFKIGIPISLIFDVIGLIVFGGWMLIRALIKGQGVGIVTTKRGRRALGKFLKRLGLSFLGEIIPFFGDIAPCWSLAVYYTLRDK